MFLLKKRLNKAQKISKLTEEINFGKKFLSQENNNSVLEKVVFKEVVRKEKRINKLKAS